MFLKAVRVSLIATVSAGIAACAQVPPPTFPEITFTDKPPLQLTVNSIEVIDEYTPPGRPPNVEHEFPRQPASVVARWASDRLVAAGGTADMRVIVKDGAATETKLKTKKGLSGLVTDEQSKRYDAVLAVRIEVYEAGFERAFTESEARRSQTVPQSITLNDRDMVFYDMTKALARDFDTEMERNIRQFLGAYVR